MTFAPNYQPRAGISAGVRTALFWLMMIGLAVVLWQMVSRPNNERSAAGMSYSDFMNQVDQNNIASVRLSTSQSTAEVYGKRRQPSQDFKVTIPKEMIPDLTERLRKQGVMIEVASPQEPDLRSTAIRFLPLVIFLFLWIFRIVRMRAKWKQPKLSEPANQPSSRPLG